MLKIFSIKKKYVFPIITILVTGLFSCKRNKQEIDVSKIDVNIKIQRFEKDLFSKPQAAVEGFDNFKMKYGNFFGLFCSQVINVGNVNDSSTKYNLQRFSNDKEVNTVYKGTIKEYDDLGSIESDLTDAFKHYKYYFPKKSIPRVVSFISGFNYGVITADSLIGIGLDMYLGKNYKYYIPMGFPLYKIERMNRNYISVDCIKGWTQSEYPAGPNAEKNMLAQMIYQGKILYFIDAMMPDAEDSLKIGYTKTQMDWIEKNEKNIWTFLIEKKLLFSTNSVDFMKYINDGPTTNGLPKEAPAQLGSWIGWQIVREYMNNNSNVTLEELMKEQNEQKVLNLSKYKPKK